MSLLSNVFKTRPISLQYSKAFLNYKHLSSKCAFLYIFKKGVTLNRLRGQFKVKSKHKSTLKAYHVTFALYASFSKPFNIFVRRTEKKWTFGEHSKVTGMNPYDQITESVSW